ncbi:MAG: DUF4091 domain-containing protein, partial [Polyangiaceae bacterium]|nr:DUF4091 domain-containing protein [Polyangiaceae bacterium]
MTSLTSAIAACAPLIAACCSAEPEKPLRRVIQPIAVDGVTVWAIDDGERIARHDGDLSWMRGEANPAWTPKGPLRLFGLPGETVAFQIAVTAGREPVHGVTVMLNALEGPATIANAAGQGVRDFRVIESFVVHELAMERRSGGKVASESLGWAKGAMPPDPSARGLLPDPLIPVELAPSWADYPMSVGGGEHRVVWFDLTLPLGLPAGVYRGVVHVRAGGASDASVTVPLDDVPVELEVGPVALPYAAVKTMVYFDPEGEVAKRTGSRAAIDHAHQLMHRHHLTTVFPIRSVADVQAHRGAVTGALYTRERGYAGPGEGVAASVVVLGAYGALGDPGDAELDVVERIVRSLQELGVRDMPGVRDVFLYAVDEQCDSPRGPSWRRALRASGRDALRGLRVGHTCSDPPAAQQVDLVMVFASAYDPELAREARAVGKRVWIYNGVVPHTGTFLTDGWPLSLRANGWIQAAHDIERWFYWEATFWNDDNRGGLGPYDPLVQAETFHNQHGDHCNGDGVLLYPGRQVGRASRSLGFEGVIPSIRLKQWRRGISDAGYLTLARQIDR